MTKQEIYRFDRICKMCGKELSGAASNRKYCAECAKQRYAEHARQTRTSLYAGGSMKVILTDVSGKRISWV